MTDPVGATLGVIGLFTTCVDCFNYVEVAKNFGTDYQRKQLKLEVARLRLSRWGKANGISSSSDESIKRYGVALQSEEDAEAVRDLLGHIVELFNAAEKFSCSYRGGKGADAVSRNDDNANEDPSLESLGSRIRNISLRRQKTISFLKKAKWALHGEKEYNRLLEDVSGFVDDLITLFPAEERQQQLCIEEVKELDDGENLEILKEAGTGVDDLLVAKASQVQEGHRFLKVQVSGNSKVKNGDYGAPGVVPRVVNHTYDGVFISGNARVHNGNDYDLSRKSVFDD